MTTKIIELGMMRPKWTKRGYRVYARIEYKDGKLSISGVEGPLASGNCRGSCGQIDMHSPHIDDLAPGWTRAMLREFWDIWGEWHLNDMQSACVHQEAMGWKYAEHHGDIVLREVPVPKRLPLQAVEEAGGLWDVSVVTRYHELAMEYALEEYQAVMAGTVSLQWDSYIGHKCPGCGHRIGSGWGFRPVPPKVLAFLANLPEVVHAPAWV
jgi:hypothetical protein